MGLGAQEVFVVLGWGTRRSLSGFKHSLHTFEAPL